MKSVQHKIKKIEIDTYMSVASVMNTKTWLTLSKILDNNFLHRQISGIWIIEIKGSLQDEHFLRLNQSN